jgi:6-pyruvoyl-tetrahydropterin synthase
MIAHSFDGDTFGPAQRLHGATYVVDVEFRRTRLDDDGVVVDIGLASQVVKATLADLNFRNLDEVETFAGRNTTTEFLAAEIFARLKRAIAAGELGATAAGLDSMRIKLHESHVAWAAYESSL